MSPPLLLWITPRQGPLETLHDILNDGDEDLSRVALLYRRPGESVRTRLQEATPLRARCAARGLRFLTQDLELALCLGADGVHLPERGAPVSALRSRVDLLGASCHSREGLKRAFDEGADYCTLSPIFASPGKGTPLGPQAFRALSQGLGPVLALGGVTDEASAKIALRHGAAGAATIRGISAASDLTALLSAFRPSS